MKKKSNPMPRGIIKPTPPPAPPKGPAPPPIRYKLQEDKTTDYKYICSLIENAPMTYLPGLLIKVTETAYAKGVFQPHGASNIVQRIEKQVIEKEANKGNIY